MKKNNSLIICLLLIIILGLIGGLVEQQKHCNKETNGTGDKEDNAINKEYFCKFTKTYRVVNLLDGYVAEVPEWSYVVLDQFQNHEAIAHKIPANLKEKLQQGKYYEFNYTIVGNGYIKTIEDINKHIVLDDVVLNSSVYSGKKARIILNISETDKQGLEQIQQDICQGMTTNKELSN